MFVQDRPPEYLDALGSLDQLQQISEACSMMSLMLHDAVNDAVNDGGQVQDLH
jgi:hypothetical protein